MIANFVLPKIVLIKIIAQICNSNSGRLEATRLEFGWASIFVILSTGANALKTLNSVNAPKIPKTPDMTVY